ncbi:hypothetical protein GCM10020221_16020 [Streptomyces thioluteus]|uniref:Uncharacterized protein n=1 Tax=Streptomyces thioluteus TaxID=66431 RepID=A0ABP6J4G7_STRTU
MKGIRAAATVVTLTGAVLLTGGVSAPGASADGASPGGPVHVVLNGAFENRPGELVDVDVQGVHPGDPVTVHSPAFGRRPVRLAPYDRDRRAQGHHGRPAVAMTARPGAYPLAVRVGGRTVARDLVRVRPQKPPSFRLSDEDGVLRPGERFALWFDDLYPGETGSSFTARSPVLPGPVRLVHDPRGSHWNNPRMFTGTVTLPTGAREGTYKIVLAGPDGRALGERTVAVRAARPGGRRLSGPCARPRLLHRPRRGGGGPVRTGRPRRSAARSTSSGATRRPTPARRAGSPRRPPPSSDRSRCDATRAGPGTGTTPATTARRGSGGRWGRERIR